MKLVVTGFDSAWSQNNSGAIVSAISTEAGWSLEGPENVSFEQALSHIKNVGENANCHIVTIDQPLIVANDSGQRPVENVVGSIIARYKGGTCSSNRGNNDKKYAECQRGMFGANAPIWGFIENLQRQGLVHSCDLDDRVKQNGKYFFEVYPAVAILGMFPEYWEPRCLPSGQTERSLPKYNPANKKKFKLHDWQALCILVQDRLRRHGISSKWLENAQDLSNPRKADQDRLDSLICLCIGLHWNSDAPTCVIGDFETGYMVVPTHDRLTEALRKAASVKNLPIQAPKVMVSDDDSPRRDQ